MDPNDELVTFCNGNVFHKEQCEQAFGDWLADIHGLGRVLTTLKVDLSSFACLSALVLITGKLYILTFYFSYYVVITYFCLIEAKIIYKSFSVMIN